MKNPSGLCMCGCGEQTPLSRWSRRGYKRGEPLMFIKGHSSRKPHEYDVDPSTGCWNWAKSVHSRFGYGQAWDGERKRGAHIVIWERETGRKVPAGHDLHHLCGNRACVNPKHLQPLTRREHMLAEGRRAYGRYPTKGAAA